MLLTFCGFSAQVQFYAVEVVNEIEREVKNEGTCIGRGRVLARFSF